MSPFHNLITLNVLICQYFADACQENFLNPCKRDLIGNPGFHFGNRLLIMPCVFVMFVLVVFDRPKLLDSVQCVLARVMQDCPL